MKRCLFYFLGLLFALVFAVLSGSFAQRTDENYPDKRSVALNSGDEQKVAHITADAVINTAKE